SPIASSPVTCHLSPYHFITSSFPHPPSSPVITIGAMIHREMLINGHFIGGECDQAVGKTVIKAPYDGKIVGTAAEGGWPELRSAIESAHEAFASWRHSPRRERQALLRRIAALVRERTDELVEILAKEVGKPLTAARGEVMRLSLTFDY